VRGGNRIVIETEEQKVVTATITDDDRLKVLARWNDGKQHPPDEPFHLTYDEFSKFIDQLIEIRGAWRSKRNK
jgi:hypothetical protein